MVYSFSYIWITQTDNPSDLFNPNITKTHWELAAMHSNLHHTSSILCSDKNNSWAINLFINVPQESIHFTIAAFKEAFGTHLAIISLEDIQIPEQSYKFLLGLACLKEDTPNLCLTEIFPHVRPFGVLVDEGKKAIAMAKVGISADFNMIVCQDPYALHCACEPFFFNSNVANQKFEDCDKISEDFCYTIVRTDVDRKFLINPKSFCDDNPEVVLADTWQETWVRLEP